MAFLYYSMKLYEFLALSDELQFQAVWNLGVFIDSIISGKIYYNLYSVGDFYAEVHYDAFTNAIIGKMAFRQGEHLDKYLGDLPEF